MIRFRDINLPLLIGTTLFILSCLFFADITLQDRTVPSFDSDTLFVHQKSGEEFSEDSSALQLFLNYIRGNQDIAAFHKIDWLSAAYTMRPDILLNTHWKLTQKQTSYPVIFFREDSMLWSEIVVDASETQPANLNVILVDEAKTMRIASPKDMRQGERAFSIALWEGELPLKELEGVEMLYPVQDLNMLYGTWIIPKGHESSLQILESWFNANDFETNVWGSTGSLWTFYRRQLTQNIILRLLSILTVANLVMIFFLFGLGRIRRIPEERIHYLLGATICSRIIKGIMLVFAQNIAASIVAIGFATILDFAQSLLVVLIVAVMLITVQVFIECIIGVIAFRRYANA